MKNRCQFITRGMVCFIKCCFPPHISPYFTTMVLCFPNQKRERRNSLLLGELLGGVDTVVEATGADNSSTVESKLRFEFLLILP